MVSVNWETINKVIIPNAQDTIKKNLVRILYLLDRLGRKLFLVISIAWLITTSDVADIESYPTQRLNQALSLAVTSKAEILWSMSFCTASTSCSLLMALYSFVASASLIIWPSFPSSILLTYMRNRSEKVNMVWCSQTFVKLSCSIFHLFFSSTCFS